MTNNPIIALDALGGDFGPKVIVPAALKYLATNAEVTLILVGDKAKIIPFLPQTYDKQRLTIHHCTEKVEMDEPPAQALRLKKDSSMRVAINLVKEEKAHACVSAGNTGALMAIARFVLKTIQGIERPAICTTLPTTQGHVHVLDLGANVDCTPEQLFQFGLMGAVLAQEVDHLPKAKLGLLNIGSEDIKGNEQVKATAELFANPPEWFDYIGFVEGDDIYQGKADVVVCDGFIGNVALKVSEGVAKMISFYLKKAFKQNLLYKFIGLLTIPVLKSFKNFIDPRQYNGANLLGLKGIVIKSHGGADIMAFTNAIEVAYQSVKYDIPNRIAQRLEKLEAQAIEAGVTQS